MLAETNQTKWNVLISNVKFTNDQSVHLSSELVWYHFWSVVSKLVLAFAAHCNNVGPLFKRLILGTLIPETGNCSAVGLANRYYFKAF